MAPLTSGATNSIDALTVSVSGVPWTSPAPTTVTCRVFLADEPVGPDVESHAERPTAASTAAATRSRRVRMPGTLPSESHQDRAVRIWAGRIVTCPTRVPLCGRGRIPVRPYGIGFSGLSGTIPPLPPGTPAGFG